MIGTQYNLKEYDYTPVKAQNILPSLEIINGTGEVLLKNSSNDGPENGTKAYYLIFPA